MGRKISLVDISNRNYDEAESDIIFPPESNNDQIYQYLTNNKAPYFVQGFNYAIICFGATGTGKTHTLHGDSTERGLVTKVLEYIIATIEKRKEELYDVGGYDKTIVPHQYYFICRFCEIVNEEIADLLSINNIINPLLKPFYDEYEGYIIKGAETKVFSSLTQFLGFYQDALNNRSQLSNEFGKLSAKSSSILMLDLIQQMQSTEGELSIIRSQIKFIDTPGTEVLSQDPETLKIKQGPKLNLGIIDLYNIIISLSNKKVNYN